MSENQKSKESQTFISEARREQIFEVTIEILDEIGFINASLSKIAQCAGISTSLISYHFKDKQHLMNYVFETLMDKSVSYIIGNISKNTSSWDKLKAFINASLEYHKTYPSRSIAMIEIIFHSRTSSNVPYYRLDEESAIEEPLVIELKKILIEGQKEEAFQHFNIDVIVSFIQGAIYDYQWQKINVETYNFELIKILEKIIIKRDDAVEK